MLEMQSLFATENTIRCLRYRCIPNQTSLYVPLCVRCGPVLEAVCSSCGMGNAVRAKFCRQLRPSPGHCSANRRVRRDGAADAIRSQHAHIFTFKRSRFEGERRHLSILFCDLVGSTELASRLDPEDWQGVVSSYHVAVTEIVSRFGGQVWTVPRRRFADLFWATLSTRGRCPACGAGRARDPGSVIDVQIGGSPEQNVQLTVRIGIHSGTVVADALSDGRATTVFGSAPNVAHCVQAVAPPNSVLISEATNRLVSGLFAVEDEGAHVLKGVEEPVRLYRVLAPSRLRGAFDAAAARGLTPFVDREQELSRLLSRWDHVHQGGVHKS